MQTALEQLDDLQQSIALALFESISIKGWALAKLMARYSPGGVGALDFHTRSPAGVSREMPADDHLDRLTLLTMKHWRLAQELGLPRWYMMTVSLQASGKYAIDFEYRDDYQEGDIMKPLVEVD